MANTTFEGAVRSKGGFKEIDVNATTGAVTENISITHDGTNSVVIIKIFQLLIHQLQVNSGATQA